MPTISARHGDIFEGGMDLTVLPCSGKGTISSATRRWTESFSLPVPADLSHHPKLGQVSELIPFPGEQTKTKFVVYAASVFNDATTADAIESIARALGTVTVAYPDIRLVEVPLLGTGAGRLSAVESIKSLATGAWHFRVGTDARVAARGQAGGREHEPARRRTQTSSDGGGYQLRRWSNSKAGVDWSSGSAAGSCSASAAAHSGGPRAGAMRGGAVGSPRWARMSRTVGPSVMKAMMCIAPPQAGQTSGKTA